MRHGVSTDTLTSIAFVSYEADVAASQISEELVALIVEVLREKREGTELSKKKLAADSGVTRTAIILMEGGQRSPSLNLAIRLATAIGIPFSKVVAEAEKRLAKSQRQTASAEPRRR